MQPTWQRPCCSITCPVTPFHLFLLKDNVSRQLPRIVRKLIIFQTSRCLSAHTHPGGLMSLLFEDLFKRLNQDIKRAADMTLSKANRSVPFDVSKVIRTDTITYGLESAISSGNWIIKRFRMERKGVTQVCQIF